VNEYTNETTYDRPTEPAVPEMEGGDFDPTEAASSTDQSDSRNEPEPEPEPQPEAVHAPEPVGAEPVDVPVDNQQAEHQQEPHTMVVVCPEDSAPGGNIVIEWQDHELAIEVPEGVGPGEEFEVEVPLDELEKPPNSMNAPDRDDAASGAEAGTATIATVNLTAPGIEPDATGRKKRKKNSAAGCCGAKPSKGTA
jgi:hypothetical protein